MHVFDGKKWVEGFLDYALQASHVRVEVVNQIALFRVEDQYFDREHKLSQLLSYIRMLGIRRVIRKVRSRQSEAVRNESWLSVGFGLVQSGTATRCVAYILPSGPQGLERASVPAALVTDLTFEQSSAVQRGFYRRANDERADLQMPRQLFESLQRVAGWNRESETELPFDQGQWEDTVKIVVGPIPTSISRLPDPPPPSPVKERSTTQNPRQSSSSRDTDREQPDYHCFGYGQYAKTQVIPNLGRRLELSTVHEINPIQIGPVVNDAVHGWDTAGWPRPDASIRNAVVATYHHSHAPLAVDLIQNGARHVIIEKPLATTEPQLHSLISALEAHPGARVHCGFQRRYSTFNSLLVKDLGGPPISMNAAIYEVPLPALHWYRWPSAGNAVVSNGCHWIDHFLFLNDYAPVTRLRADRLATQVALSIELENGSSAVISLRHEGAPRQGVRDLCVFWRGSATATIEDLSHYRSEVDYRTLRSRRCHRYQALESMYLEFGRRIVEDTSGDSLDSIVRSTTTVVRLAEMLDDG